MAVKQRIQLAMEAIKPDVKKEMYPKLVEVFERLLEHGEQINNRDIQNSGLSELFEEYIGFKKTGLYIHDSKVLNIFVDLEHIDFTSIVEKPIKKAFKKEDEDPMKAYNKLKREILSLVDLQVGEVSGDLADSAPDFYFNVQCFTGGVDAEQLASMMLAELAYTLVYCEYCAYHSLATAVSSATAAQLVNEELQREEKEKLLKEFEKEFDCDFADLDELVNKGEKEYMVVVAALSACSFESHKSDLDFDIHDGEQWVDYAHNFIEAHGDNTAVKKFASATDAFLFSQGSRAGEFSTVLHAVVYGLQVILWVFGLIFAAYVYANTLTGLGVVFGFVLGGPPLAVILGLVGFFGGIWIAVDFWLASVPFPESPNNVHSASDLTRDMNGKIQSMRKNTDLPSASKTSLAKAQDTWGQLEEKRQESGEAETGMFSYFKGNRRGKGLIDKINDAVPFTG